MHPNTSIGAGGRLCISPKYGAPIPSFCLYSVTVYTARDDLLGLAISAPALSLSTGTYGNHPYIRLGVVINKPIYRNQGAT